MVERDDDLPRRAIPPGRDRAWLEAALARIPRNDADVSYLGSLYVPSDESCFCRFTAPDAENVPRLNELAGVPFARVVAAVELSPNAKEKHHALPRIDRRPGRRRKRRGSIGADKTGSGHDGKPSAGLELTYTKWVAPATRPWSASSEATSSASSAGPSSNAPEPHLHSPDGHLHRDRSRPGPFVHGARQRHGRSHHAARPRGARGPGP